MSDWRKEHVVGEIEATLDGFEKFLSPSAMAELRAGMVDAFTVHPVLSALAEEHIPRQQEQSGDVPVDPAAARAEQQAKKNAKKTAKNG